MILSQKATFGISCLIVGFTLFSCKSTSPQHSNMASTESEKKMAKVVNPDLVKAFQEGNQRSVAYLKSLEKSDPASFDVLMAIAHAEHAHNITKILSQLFSKGDRDHEVSSVDKRAKREIADALGGGAAAVGAWSVGVSTAWFTTALAEIAVSDAALLTNPFIILGAVIVGEIVYVGVKCKDWKSITGWTNDMDDALEKLDNRRNNLNWTLEKYLKTSDATKVFHSMQELVKMRGEAIPQSSFFYSSYVKLLTAVHPKAIRDDRQQHLDFLAGKSSL